jgi:hypothetical protein
MTTTPARYRLRSSGAFNGRDSGMVGVIDSIRLHESNRRSMFCLTFERDDHQRLWANAWFYLDDIEEVK